LGGGRVLGLGRGVVQTILNRHGITPVLAAKGMVTRYNKIVEEVETDPSPKIEVRG